MTSNDPASSAPAVDDVAVQLRATVRAQVGQAAKRYTVAATSPVCCFYARVVVSRSH